MIVKTYYPASPTIEAFHRCDAPARALVGAVGTAKTTGALWEVGWNLPRRCYEYYGITHTRWFVVRKNYTWLMDTDFEAAMDWFLHGQYRGLTREMTIHWPRSESVDTELIVDLDFRAADTDDDEKKFRSTAATGAWIDEAIELRQTVKNVIISRLGRFPKIADTPCRYTPHYLIETTNPCGVDHPIYWMYRWVGPKVIKAPTMGEDGIPLWPTGEYDTGELVSKMPSGPVPPKAPVRGFIGFWQEPGENSANLRGDYWKDIERMYPESPEMRQMLVEGKPGYRPEGKGVYRNYKQEIHMAKAPIEWAHVDTPLSDKKVGVPLIMGWDNSGTNNIAAVLLQHIAPMQYQVLREFFDDRMTLVDLTRMIVEILARDYAGAKITHWCDPAGFAMHPQAVGGNTSNAQIQADLFGLQLNPAEQSLDKRISAVDQLLIRRDGLLIDPRCTRLLSGFFGGYVYEERPNMGFNEFKPQPKDNKFTHVHDALQYAIVNSVYPLITEPRPDLEEEQAMIAAQNMGGVPWHRSRSYERDDYGDKDFDPREW